MFTFHCPHCQASLSSEPSRIGTHANCPKCQRQFTVPPPLAKVAGTEKDESEKRKKRRPAYRDWSGATGYLMILWGGYLSVYYWLLFDTATYSLETATYLHNFGRMNDRLVGVIIGVGLCLGGTFILLLRHPRQK